MKTQACWLALVLAIGLGGFAPAHSNCVWKWDCTNGNGQCRQVPLCDSAIDLPPIKPAQIPPLAPPTIRPIPQPTLPPIGTSQCAPRYMCSANGCRWQTVCN
jgi:hypothetical protein